MSGRIPSRLPMSQKADSRSRIPSPFQSRLQPPQSNLQRLSPIHQASPQRPGLPSRISPLPQRTGLPSQISPFKRPGPSRDIPISPLPTRLGPSKDARISPLRQRAGPSREAQISPLSQRAGPSRGAQTSPLQKLQQRSSPVSSPLQTHPDLRRPGFLGAGAKGYFERKGGKDLLQQQVPRQRELLMKKLPEKVQERSTPTKYLHKRGTGIRPLTPKQYERVTPGMRKRLTPEFREEFSTEPKESLRTSSLQRDKYFEPMEERSVHILDAPHQLPGVSPDTAEASPPFSTTVMLTSPKRAEPLLVNIDVDPKPLTDTEHGETFICDISLNVQPGGHDMLPQLPANQILHSDSTYSDIMDQSPPPYLLRDAFLNRMSWEKTPSPPRRPYYARDDIRLQSPPPDLLQDAFLDESMSWDMEPSPGIYDDEDIRYQPPPPYFLEQDSSGALSDGRMSWERPPSPLRLFDADQDMRHQPPPSLLNWSLFRRK